MTVGIVAELNPFHKGHEKLIQKVKEKYKDATIVVVLSGNFQQRGIPSLLDKWTKTEIILHHGVDLVVELPFFYATQSADIFATGAISLLKALEVDVIAFGTESNDIKGLKSYAIAQEDESFNSLVQVFLKMGNNYPTALSLALEELTGKRYQLPNDLLIISYLKAMKKLNANFELFPVQREKDYHDENKSCMMSANFLRKSLKDEQRIDNYIEKDVLKALSKGFSMQDDYFPYLEYKILSSRDLSIYLGVDENLLPKLKEKILVAKNYEELIHSLETKNHTYNYLSRTLLHILVGFRKEDAKKTFKNYIRLLGFTEKGQRHLNQIKKNCPIPIISKFRREHQELLKLDILATSIYALGREDKNKLIHEEFQKAPIRVRRENEL